MSTTEAAAIAYPESSTLPLRVRAHIFLYLGLMIVLIGFGGPMFGIMDIPIAFFLKNKLHLSPSAVADFRLAAAIPLYLSFVFGFVRDTWNPFGIRDRGYLILFGSATAMLYVAFAFAPVSYATLLAAVALLTISFLFVWSAQNGLTSMIGRQHVMSGQVSAIWNIFGYIPTMSAYLIGGAISDRLEGKNAAQAARLLFLTGALVMAAIAAYGFWKPKAVFDNVRDEGEPVPRRVSDLTRLARHWPIYPAMLVWFLWCFAPGTATPLQFYLQNTLHGNDAAYADWYAIFVVSFIPTFMLFGVLCRRVKLRTLLLWGTIVGVPQALPLLVLHSVAGALAGAAIMGLLGGVCTAAYVDLIIRSAPRGLEGTTLMMSWALYYVAVRFGDVLGTALYEHMGGFRVCVIATTIVYALIVPVLYLVPRRLTATADGELPKGGY